jgi:hypothetical protein
MQLSLSDSMVSEFLSGLLAVFALLGVGAAIMLILTSLANKFPFSRLALVLALTPFCLIRFVDRGTESTLFLYAMILVLLGITIDGINYLLMPRAQTKPSANSAAKTDETSASDPEAEEEEKPGMIVWEKAE